tara:strand:- start:5402 stop:5509 length:108 start_codon:yes stop_codon:yes gene_type:complete
MNDKEKKEITYIITTVYNRIDDLKVLLEKISILIK